MKEWLFELHHNQEELASLLDMGQDNTLHKAVKSQDLF